MTFNNFALFQADVWGTVSDWAMVIVTALTAYFLYKTLQSQLHITKIERSRYIKENMPVFSVDEVSMDISPIKFIKGKYHLRIELNINSDTTNIAYNFATRLVSNSNWETASFGIDDLIKPNTSFLKVFHQEVEKQYKENFLVDRFSFILTFSDYHGNFFEQSVNYFLLFQNQKVFAHEVTITYP